MGVAADDDRKAAPPARHPWIGYAALVGALVYIAIKVFCAGTGELGMPGFPAPPEKYESDPNVAARQLGNAAVGAATAVLALATVQTWGRVFPRWLLQLGCLGALAMLGSGGVGYLARATEVTDAFGPPPADWRAYPLTAFILLWSALWAVLAWSCRRTPAERQTAGDRQGGTGRSAGSARG